LDKEHSPDDGLLGDLYEACSLGSNIFIMSAEV
jgi:hypothetical protein